MVLRIVARIRRTRVMPVYTISMTSRLTALPIWTIRWIERHELIEPQRTEGNQRLFSDAEIDLLNQIRELLEEEINLPGIRKVLQLHRQLTRMASGEEHRAPRSRERAKVESLRSRIPRSSHQKIVQKPGMTQLILSD